MISAEDLIQESQEVNTMRLGVVAELFPHGTAKVQFDGEDTASEKEYAYLSNFIPKIGDRVLLSKFGKTYIILGALSYAIPPIIEDGNKYLFDEEEVVMQNGLDVTGLTKLNSGLTVTGNASISGSISASSVSSGSISSTGTISGASANLTGELKASGISTTGAAAGNNTVRTNNIYAYEISISRANISNTLSHTGSYIGFFGKSPTNKIEVSWANKTDSQRLQSLAYALRDYGLISLSVY